MKSKRIAKVLRVLGLLLLFAAALALLFNVWDEYRAGNSVQKTLQQMTAEPAQTALLPVRPADALEAESTEVLDPAREMPEQEIDGRTYIGVLEVPSLELRLPVLSEWSYPGLRIAPCRYEGTAYQPGFVLAAHNYESHFGRLKTLAEGERILFTDVDGSTVTYEVRQHETIAPDDFDALHAGDWDLTLFTCTYGGQSRILTRCALVESTENTK